MGGLSETLGAQLRESASEAPEWAAAVRGRGAEAFTRHGLPHARLEAWKYTPLKRLEDTVEGLAEARPARSDGVAPLDVEANVAVTLQGGAPGAIEGRVGDGVTVQQLEDALAEAPDALRQLLDSLDTDHPAQAFSALNDATLRHGLFIHVPGGVDAGRLLLHFAGAGPDCARELLNTRICIVLGEGARLQLVEQFESADEEPSALNLVVQAQLGNRAVLEHARLQHESTETTLVTRTVASLASKSRYRYTALDLGGALVRHDLDVRLEGSAAGCELSGAYLPRGDSHVDNHLAVEHRAPDCSSRQVFRGVVDGRARVVWNGRVHVLPGADGTEAEQSNANLLLSDYAEVNTKPELEIEADEVMASHGATVGQIDEDALFYLRSRGLDESSARQVLVSAFCREVVEGLSEASVREAFLQRLEAWLEDQS